MTTIIKSPEGGESSGQTKEKKSKKKGKEKPVSEEKDIYFIILYPRKQQEKPDEFAFTETDINPQKIFTDELKLENETYFYKKVFKFKGKTNQKYSPEFEIGKDNYIISFEVKEDSFIYDVELKKGNKILKNIAKEIIDQKIDYHKKLDIFLEALKKNNEENKDEALYKETIDLFEKKKGFSFLISLFIQIYKNKELCPLLMEKFKDMNSKAKENDKNMDRSKDLEDYIETFSQISSEAENLIKDNEYAPIQFYGILLCYLNYYDHKNFMIIFKKLYTEKWEVLFEILLIYFSHFLNPINQDLDFFTKFINYTISKKEFSIFEKGLNYIRDIETFIIVIEKTKEQIFDKYFKSDTPFSPIKLKANLDLIKKEKNKEMKTIIPSIESIINYSKDKKVLLVYFTSNFWIQILKEYNIPDDINIENCFKLRETFINYNKLVNELFKNEKKSDIKKDINKYFERDEFAFILDKNIKKLLDNNKESNKELSNSEILGFVEAFNPYYKEEKYSYKRDTYIFDYINLDDNSEQFIETFQKLKFEEMFKDNINEFLNKMISKIKNIPNFGTILTLIDIKKTSKVDEFYNQLKDKYESVIKKQIDSLTGKELDDAIEITAKFVDLLFIHEKDCKFIEQKINKLNKKISSLIYNELMRRCKGDEYKPMKELIYKKFLNKLENIDNIIELIGSLDKDDKKTFLEELMKKCLFTKEEYYSNNENAKILLLCKLNEKKIIKINEEGINYVDIEKILQLIRKDLEGEIEIKKLKEFLENDKKSIINKLGLIKIILSDFGPEEEYSKLKEIIEKIKNDIDELSLIKNSLLIFHRNKYQREIRDISNLIKDMQEKNLKNYKAEATQESIKNIMDLKPTVENVKKVKDILLFKVLYDEAYGNDQEKRFEDASEKLKNMKKIFGESDAANKIYQDQENKPIFNKIKEMLSKNEAKAEIFIEQMKTYFNLKGKDELIKDLTIIFKSKKYEMDLKSIIYFFENLNFKNDKEDDWNKKLPSKFKNLSEMNLEELKKNLKELKDNKIYDYEEKNNNYFKLFTSLYEKKEAIDFLLSKINQNISSLYEKIDPTNRTITKEKIQDTEECIKIFNEFKEKKSNLEIFEYIKTLKPEQISKFEIYSKNYSSIIELDRNDDSSLNLYKQVSNYIQNSTFIFRQDAEDFSYGESGTTNMEELIHLKNKIHIKPPKETKEPKDEFQKKCYELIFFKKVISNLEVIYEYMKVLRIKGSSLPILIQY